MHLEYSPNLSMLFTEVTFLQRFAKAAQAGFSAVEFLFPYEAGVQAIMERMEVLGLRIALFNLPAGSVEKGEWGTLGLPDRRDYFKRSFMTALEAANDLNCDRLNMMFGQRNERYRLETQMECACENLTWAAPQAAQAGVELLIEPLNPADFPNYALTRTSQARDVVEQVQKPNVKILYDVYHAQMTEGNLISTITSLIDHIGHIQIADVPGRHQPGTGEINFRSIFATLEQLNYSDYIGLEYRPLGDSEASLSWLPLVDRQAD
jgi:hydroxypyruvate isomerase